VRIPIHRLLRFSRDFIRQVTTFWHRQVNRICFSRPRDECVGGGEENKKKKDQYEAVNSLFLKNMYIDPGSAIDTST
jgi:hypothetical protein